MRLSITSVTNREKEVLYLISIGQSHKEISFQLGIGFNTVRQYNKSLLSKLEATNSAELVRKGIQSGLLKIPPTVKKAS